MTELLIVSFFLLLLGASTWITDRPTAEHQAEKADDNDQPHH